MKKRIHIVSLDVPFPPDYGAVIDIYYRCKALKEAGYFVILHCFEYGRGENHLYNEVADKCFFYKRKLRFFDVFSFLPFIVKTRVNNALLSRLLDDDAPILLEGQHCTWFLKNLVAKSKKVAVRIHNVEWYYYNLLSKREKHFLKKHFFKFEALKLKKHEAILEGNFLFCVTEADQNYYLKKVCNAVLSPSQFNREKSTSASTENFVLYHGNLSIAENSEALQTILNEYDVEKFPLPLIVAGKNPSNELIEQLRKRSITLIANPDEDKMNQLIQRAKVHLLISNQASGLKLKVLNSLYSGSYCIATTEILYGTTLSQFCTVWDRKTTLASLLQHVPDINSENKEARITWLDNNYGPQTFLENIEIWLSN